MNTKFIAPDPTHYREIESVKQLIKNGLSLKKIQLCIIRTKQQIQKPNNKNIKPLTKPKKRSFQYQKTHKSLKNKL